MIKSIWKCARFFPINARSLASEGKYKGETFENFVDKKMAQKQAEENKRLRNKLREFQVSSNMIIVPPQIQRDLDAMNLAKTVTLTDLKKQYHKFVKIYHPDLAGDTIENKEQFRKLTGIYERLTRWVLARDTKIDDVAFKINQSLVDRTVKKADIMEMDQISKIDLLKMMEQESVGRGMLFQRVHLYYIHILLMMWAVIGIATIGRDFDKYVTKLWSPRPNVDYSNCLNPKSISNIQQAQL